MLLYLSSTLYHALPGARAKRVFRILDHSAIYLLIAGTYTPFTLVILRGVWGWSLFGVVWTLAMGGIIFKGFFTGRLETLSNAVYVGMGWVALVAIRPLLSAMPWEGALWLLAGGIAYTSGLVFYGSKRRYAHAVWHLFVLAGSSLHFFVVYRYVLPHHG
ncbi:MAG TPA: hemolysin III family protein [Terriglobales bacterium]|nr:hemolysin III family protein [Terriglobales bacterium]